MYTDYLAWKSFCICRWRFLAVNWDQIENKSRELEHVEYVSESITDFAKQKQNTKRSSTRRLYIHCRMHAYHDQLGLNNWAKRRVNKKKRALAASYFRNVTLNYNAPTSCSMFGTDCFILCVCFSNLRLLLIFSICTYV